MDKVYCEHANGRVEYWTYSDGRRVFVTEAWARKEVRRGTAEIVYVRELYHPLERLRHHVTGAIERGETEAIVEKR